MSKKYIEVILENKIKNLGDPGNMIKVSLGYARNHLFPNHHVSLITKQKLQQISILEKKKQSIQKAEKAENTKIKSLIEVIYKFNIKKQVSNTNQIFGRVSEKEIIELIKEKTGFKIDKNQIILTPINSIGIYPLTINLMDNITANIVIQILPAN